MNVGILGSGKVGGAIGKGLARRGHTVVFASRDPLGSKQELLSQVPAARVQTLQETVDASDLLVVAIPWNALPDVLSGLRGLEGKILLDATNRFGNFEKSAAEDLAALIPGAKVVKAFNTLGYEHMDGPQFIEKPSMLVAGDDLQAKRIVMQLSEELGFEAIDAGPLSSAAALELLARTWVGLTRTLGRNFAFRVLRK
ncbi:MAG: NADPH-dependent F420 reductase [Meiothermus sp.]|uniref:NADPH-dependent F420 reductase n=3 Tax=Meiothermus hypogaeus TaxID=884155 RepID=A0A511R1Z0_9DEIN|nr:Pyrroline-5-carboxylate reductase [Meiothermus hypogaeus]GEM83016.1 NADPH-dependent F420 reductase [Meiothermus hypogaeus NBRC 106114]GIW36800.1 MAG: NADPH-dependent F420 reductase [Meiothermus sp.]